MKLPSDPWVLDQLKDVCDRAVKMQEDRYASLLDTSNRILVSISILSVAITSGFGLAVQINERTACMWPLVTAIALFLLASFICALASQWRMRYRVFTGPLADELRYFDLEDSATPKGPKLDSKQKALVHVVKGLDEYHAALKRRNDRILRLIAAPLSLLLIAVSLIFIALIAALIFRP
ncbi:MAG: hypothetical protein IJ087_22965 [Eggerthellaceae bacterium]|nr:hypothetical protein [Eggerthellaceae bacterium]